MDIQRPLHRVLASQHLALLKWHSLQTLKGNAGAQTFLQDPSHNSAQLDQSLAALAHLALRQSRSPTTSCQLFQQLPVQSVLHRNRLPLSLGDNHLRRLWPATNLESFQLRAHLILHQEDLLRLCNKLLSTFDMSCVRAKVTSFRAQVSQVRNVASLSCSRHLLPRERSCHRQTPVRKFDLQFRTRLNSPSSHRKCWFQLHQRRPPSIYRELREQHLAAKR